MALPYKYAPADNLVRMTPPYRIPCPEDPKTLVTIRSDDPEDRLLLKTLLHGVTFADTPEDALEQLRTNAAMARAIQQHLAEADRESQP